MFDKETVKTHTRGSCDRVLEAIGLPKECLTKKHGSCPKCGEGTDRFRFFDDWLDTGGCICSTCNPEGAADLFATIQWWLGCSFDEAVDKAGLAIGLKPPNEKQAEKPKTPEEQLTFIEWNSRFEKMFLFNNEGVTREGLNLAGAKMANYQGKAVIAFPCYGETLDVVGWVVMNCASKHVTTYGKDGKTKRQVRHKQVAGSKSGLIGPLKDGFLKLDVIKAEGLTDLLALLSIGKPGVTNSSGSNETPKWMAERLSHFKSVSIIHDADQPGQTGAERWAGHISANPDCEVRNVQLPFEVMKTHGKDLRDFLLDGDDPAGRLEALIAGSIRIEPGSITIKDDWEEILADLDIDVIGETERGEILIWSKYCEKQSIIRNTRALSKAQLLQFCGQPAKEAISEDKHSMKSAVSAISLAASKRRINERNKPKGAGIYQSKDLIVLSNGKHLSTFNGSFEKVDTPRCGDLIFNFDGHVWFSHESLSGLLERAKDPGWCSEAIDKMAGLIDRWTWREQDLAPPILTGLILATFSQSVWKWRPSVSIRGESNCGKTSLAKVLFGDTESKGVFGDLACYVAQSTAAGIRQQVATDSTAICLDEWDSTPLRSRQEILGLIRTSGGGERSLRGSTSHKAEAFGMRHVVWIMGIVAGMDENADRNRFLPFQMKSPPPDRAAAWIEPTQAERDEMFSKMLAISVVHAQRAALTASELHRSWQSDKNLDARQTANLAVPVAMLATATGQDADEIFSKSTELILETSQEITRDDAKLLERIMELQVRGPSSEQFPVHFVLFGDSMKSQEMESQCLYQLGIENYEIGGEGFVAIYPPMIAKHLETESTSIAQLLRNLPGCRSHQHRSVIGKKRWILVPKALCASED